MRTIVGYASAMLAAVALSACSMAPAQSGRTQVQGSVKAFAASDRLYGDRGTGRVPNGWDSVVEVETRLPGREENGDTQGLGFRITADKAAFRVSASKTSGRAGITAKGAAYRVRGQSGGAVELCLAGGASAWTEAAAGEFFPGPADGLPRCR